MATCKVVSKHRFIPKLPALFRLPPWISKTFSTTPRKIMWTMQSRRYLRYLRHLGIATTMLWVYFQVVQVLMEWTYQSLMIVTMTNFTKIVTTSASCTEGTRTRSTTTVHLLPTTDAASTSEPNARPSYTFLAQELDVRVNIQISACKTAPTQHRQIWLYLYTIKWCGQQMNWL